MDLESPRAGQEGYRRTGQEALSSIIGPVTNLVSKVGTLGSPDVECQLPAD